jgi:hypothetical protein
MDIKLKLLNKDLSIVHMDELAAPGEIFKQSGFVSVTKTNDEISLITETMYVRNDWRANSGWKAFFIVGPLDFSLVGILREVLALLADAGISIFAISTFNTDYILVKNEQVENALQILSGKFEIETVS